MTKGQILRHLRGELSQLTRDARKLERTVNQIRPALERIQDKLTNTLIARRQKLVDIATVENGGDVELR